MKITCDVVRDLLPLYVEGIASEDTRVLIEEHIASCGDCRKQMEEMSAPAKAPADTDTAPMRRLKSMLIKRKMRTVVISAILALAAAIIVVAAVAAPRYFPYNKETVFVTKSADGTVLATFGDQVTGYGVSSSLADDGSGYVCHIAAWDSVWDGKIRRNRMGNTVLNPRGEQVSAVYYYQTDGSGEVLIYGEPQNPSGVIIRQPKLSLLAACAAAAAILFGIVLVIFRKNGKVRNVIEKVLPMPIAYLLGHLFVKGFSTASYSATHDFFLILLAAIPVYALVMAAIYLAKRHKRTA